MRIAQLVTQARGGPVDHAVDIARELARSGHDSHLIAPDPALTDLLVGSGVTVHVAAMEHKTDLTGARLLVSTLDALSADVVHCQDRRAGLIGRLHARRRGTATVYTLHGVPDPLADLVPGNLRPVARRRGLGLVNFTAERWLANAPRTRVITPCAALADYATDHVGIPAGRVRVVHNGIDPHWGESPWPGPDGHLRTATTTIAWLGVMAPVKRVPAVVRATAMVPGIRALLIGDGPERVRVEAEISAAGIADRVDLAGHVPEPAALLRRADLLVLPSAAEACPMAILQAMSCGIPVIASAVGGIAEVVRHGIDGLLVPAGDDEALARALRTLHEDVALRARMGASARDRVLDMFTLERCARALVAVYEEVAR